MLELRKWATLNCKNNKDSDVSPHEQPLPLLHIFFVNQVMNALEKGAPNSRRGTLSIKLTAHLSPSYRGEFSVY